MRKLGLIVGVLLVCSTAQAKVLELYGQVQGGGQYGKGIAGDQKDNDFFFGAKGASYGALVGAEFMWVDAWVEHNQFTNGSRVTGTWTQFMVGFDYDFPIGDPPGPGQRPKTYAQIALDVGFGMGTGRQVDPPLDNTQITDKGPVGQLAFGAEYRFNRVMSLGMSVPIEYAYLYKNVPGSVANDSSQWYHSVHAMALLYLQFHLELK